MRAAAVLLITAASVALAVVAVHAFDDRRTLVPPPDAVAEGFVRQILAGRSEQGIHLVSGSLSRRLAPDRLDDYGKKLEEELGKIANVLAESEESSPGRARATATLEGARGTKTLSFELVRKKGEWVIEKLGGFEADLSSAELPG